jgi:hypothetical protein
MDDPLLDRAVAESERVLRERGFLRLAPPPVSMTEEGLERMFRRWYETCERLDLTVEKMPDSSLLAYYADTPIEELDRIRKAGAAGLN